MKIFKRILKWIGVVLGILLLIGVLQIGWGMYREPIAKKQAMDFCAGITVGQATKDIAEQAVASGAEARFAKWHAGPNGENVMLVTFVGMPPFSRHICTVKATSVVVSAEYHYMD